MESNSLTFNRSSHYAQRVSRIPRSCIREIMSAAGSKKLISFGGGIPHDSCIPLDTIQAAFESLMAKYGTSAFRYGESEGVMGLREYIANVWLDYLGIKADPSEVLIVNGSQQALDLIGKVFIDEHTPILLERPTYLAALQAFNAYSPQFREVALDCHGVLPYELKDRLTNHGCRFFYTVPSFQNPSGICYSLERRIQTAELLNKSNVLLIEDDPYSQLYYDTPPPPPICSLGVDKSIFLGTFSKMVAPGFRLGWIWTKSEAFRHLVTVKQAADLCTGNFQQLLLLEVLNKIDLHGHLYRNRQFYRNQCDTMHKYMTKHFGTTVSWAKPHGGMFFWAQLPDHISTNSLLNACVNDGVAFGDGAFFFANGNSKNFMRLNFTQANPEQMDEGLGVIAHQIKIGSCN